MEGKMKMIIESWKAVAYWEWEVNEKSCSICMNYFTLQCPNCKFPGDECPLCNS